MQVTYLIILLCVIVFIIQYVFPQSLVIAFLGLIPRAALKGCLWQFITYMFVHGGPMHLFINMFVLAMFGPWVERRLKDKFIALYLLSGLGSAFLHILISGELNVPMLGASGAIFGVLTAYGFLFPKQIIIMFPGIPMPAFLAIFVFAAIEFLFGIFGIEPGVANWGHLGGILTGIIFMLLWKKRRSKNLPIEFEFFWE